MDPNALLAEIRSHYGDDTELAYLVEDLDEWLTNRGFLPGDWERSQELESGTGTGPYPRSGVQGKELIMNPTYRVCVRVTDPTTHDGFESSGRDVPPFHVPGSPGYRADAVAMEILHMMHEANPDAPQITVTAADIDGSRDIAAVTGRLNDRGHLVSERHNIPVGLQDGRERHRLRLGA